MSAPRPQDEFREFQLSDSSDEASVPSSLRGGLPSSLLSEIQRDLNPPALLVFTKLFGIHAATSVMTLAVCPQFGFRTFGEGMGLMHYFMGFGEHGCLIACGIFFTGMSLLIAGLVLRGEELRTIRQNRAVGMAALTLLSLGFFTMARWYSGATFLVGISLTLAWLAGAFLGSVGSLELTWRVRFRPAR